MVNVGKYISPIDAQGVCNPVTPQRRGMSAKVKVVKAKPATEMASPKWEAFTDPRIFHHLSGVWYLDRMFSREKKYRYILSQMITSKFDVYMLYIHNKYI